MAGTSQAIQQLRRMKLEEGIEEKEALTQDDFENLVKAMDEEVEERDTPIERLRNLDLIVFDNSIRYDYQKSNPKLINV